MSVSTDSGIPSMPDLCPLDPVKTPQHEVATQISIPLRTECPLFSPDMVPPNSPQTLACIVRSFGLTPPLTGAWVADPLAKHGHCNGVRIDGRYRRPGSTQMTVKSVLTTRRCRNPTQPTVEPTQPSAASIRMMCPDARPVKTSLYITIRQPGSAEYMYIDNVPRKSSDKAPDPTTSV